MAAFSPPPPSKRSVPPAPPARCRWWTSPVSASGHRSLDRTRCIGRRARYLASIDDARLHIAGYVLSNDLSERDFQFARSGGQWSKGKSCETFNPLGPWLVTPDELGDPQHLRLRSSVNGRPRQDSTTADMIFGVAELVYELSRHSVLEPGDLINTGTPQGVALSGRFPYLTEGDLVTLEIERLGRQDNRCQRAIR